MMTLSTSATPFAFTLPHTPVFPKRLNVTQPPLQNRHPCMCASPPSLPRRRLFHLALALAAISSPPAHASTVPAARTLLNGVLSGYGLPNVADATGTVPVVQQYGDAVVVRFFVPRSWVVRRAFDARTAQQGRASGLTAGDYRRGEGVALFVADRDADVATLVTPGDAVEGDADAVVIRDARMDDGARVLETTFETTTRSGYVVRRRAITRAIVAADGRVYALSGCAVAERWRTVKPLMQAAIDSFEVFRL